MTGQFTSFDTITKNKLNSIYSIRILGMQLFPKEIYCKSENILTFSRNLSIRFLCCCFSYRALGITIVFNCFDVRLKACDFWKITITFYRKKPEYRIPKCIINFLSSRVIQWRQLGIVSTLKVQQLDLMELLQTSIIAMLIRKEDKDKDQGYIYWPAGICCGIF